MLFAIGLVVLGFISGATAAVWILIPVTEGMAARSVALDDAERAGELRVIRRGGWLWGKVRIVHSSAHFAAVDSRRAIGSEAA